MGRDLWEASARVKELFALASDTTGLDCRKLLFESGEEQLKATDVSQVAITLANRAASVVLAEHGVTADGCAGFSLGEYAALQEAGVIDDAALFSIVQMRGRIMEEASRRQDTAAGPAGMAAVVGLTYEEVVRVVEDLRKGDDSLALYPALRNAPTQTVVSGTAEALQAAEAAFEEAGAMNYVVLKTSGPFHSPLMQEAARRLEEELEAYRFSDPVKPLYSNVTGGSVNDAAEIKRLCARQLISPVRWTDVEQSVWNDGYDQFLEVGPGKVLAGLWKRFSRKVKCLPVGTLEGIESLEGEE